MRLGHKARENIIGWRGIVVTAADLKIFTDIFEDNCFYALRHYKQKMVINDDVKSSKFLLRNKLPFHLMHQGNLCAAILKNVVHLTIFQQMCK